MFDADEMLESIYKKYGISWDFVIHKQVNFFKLKKYVKSKCIKFVEAYDNPVVITTDNIYHWLLNHVNGSFEYIPQEKFEDIDNFDRSRTILQITTFDYNVGVEQYLWHKGFHNNVNIYYAMELDGYNINFHINRLIPRENEHLHNKLSRNLRVYLQYTAQYHKFAVDILEKRKKFTYNGIGGVIPSATDKNNPVSVIRAANEDYRFQYCSESSRYSLKKLIVYYLYVRDFPSAYIYIYKYSKLFPDDTMYEKDLIPELESLFEKMTERSNSISQDSIIVNWIDNVPHAKLCDLPWVEEQINSGLKFDNAFSTMPWTTWVMKTMFSGDGAISGKMFNRGKIGAKSGEYPVFDYLTTNGYSVKYAGRRSRGENMFTKQQLCKTNETDESMLSTRSQWFGVCDLLKREEKSFIILHTLLEVHMPYASPDAGYLDWRDPVCSEEKKTASRHYVDERIKWYSRFYGKNTTKIWMSDHGDSYVRDKDGNGILINYYDDLKTHVFFGVTGDNIRQQNESRFFTFECFKGLTKYLVEQSDADYDKIFIPYVTYENYNSYSPTEVIRQVRMSKEKREATKGTWQQLIGIRNEHFKYIKFSDGDEIFLVLPDERTNEISNPAYESEISSMRAIVDKKEFIDIYKEEFFIQSRKLYE